MAWETQRRRKEIICLAPHLSYSFWPFYSASPALDPDLAQHPLFHLSSSPRSTRPTPGLFSHAEDTRLGRGLVFAEDTAGTARALTEGSFPARRKQGSMVVGHPRRSGGGQLLPWTRVHEYLLLISGQRVSKALDAKL